MRTTDKERREHVDLFYKSGLMPVAFCAKHALNVKTFYVWLRRYPRDDRQTPQADALAPCFIPLQIQSDEMPIKALQKQTLSFKTKNFCLDITLNLQENFADLKRIVQALDTLS